MPPVKNGKGLPRKSIAICISNRDFKLVLSTREVEGHSRPEEKVLRNAFLVSLFRGSKTISHPGLYVRDNGIIKKNRDRSRGLYGSVELHTSVFSPRV